MKTKRTESCIVCFSPDTPISLADGSTRAIAHINVGEAILALEQASDALVRASVEVVASSLHMDHVVLSLEDGTTLACTDDHPLWVDGKGWCVADPRKASANYGLATKRLSIEDKLLVIRSGLLMPVGLRCIEVVARPSRMWIIGTGGAGTFFANGVLAHDENVGSLDLTKAHWVTVERSISHRHEEPALA